MMSATATRGVRRPAIPARSFSALPSTRSTLGQRGPGSGSICAAQPVTTMRAPGFSRRARRMAWRAWRSASAVTAQVLTTTVSVEPRRGVAADDLAFVGVQPATEGERRRRSCRQRPDRCCRVKAVATGPGHQHVAVRRAIRWPARRRRPAPRPCGSVRPRRAAYQGGAGAGAAGQRQPGAALPHPQADAVRGEHLGEADIGALGKHRGVLQRRPDRRDRHGGEVGDEERRVRVAHRAGGRVGHRAPARSRCSVSASAGERDVAPVQARPAPCRRVTRPSARTWRAGRR